MTSYDDLVARVRGLNTRLLPESAISLAAGCGDVASLASQLVALRVITPSAGMTTPQPRELELALRRRAGARLHIIERWAGPRANDLAPLLDDEDRRSLRALVRGAAARIDPEVRVAGLIPTTTLPLRALDELSRLGDLTPLAAALLAWNHPFAHALTGDAVRLGSLLFVVQVDGKPAGDELQEFTEKTTGSTPPGETRAVAEPQVDEELVDALEDDDDFP